MAIDCSCPSCGQRYRLKDELAGRRAKCKKCDAVMKVPNLAPPPAAVDPGFGSLFDEELAAPAAAKPLSAALPSQPQAPSDTRCPSCKASLPKGAVLCVQCGYDFDLGKARVMRRETDDAPKKPAAPRGSTMLIRGTLLSGVGALLGAFVWFAITIITQLELGWIAWGVGVAAGAGMTLGLGAHDKGDGTLPGIIAACMSLVGIFLGKLFVFIWVLYPLLIGDLDSFQYKRELIAGAMAHQALLARGIDPEDAADMVVQDEIEEAMQRLESKSDEEIDVLFRQLNEAAEADAADAQAAEVQLADAEAEGEDEADVDPAEMDGAQEAEANQQLQQAAAVMPGQADDPAAAGELAHAAAGPAEEPEISLASAFFKVMFGPIDGLFILLAFFTAYKVGSGKSGN